MDEYIKYIETPRIQSALKYLQIFSISREFSGLAISADPGVLAFLASPDYGNGKAQLDAREVTHSNEIILKQKENAEYFYITRIGIFLFSFARLPLFRYRQRRAYFSLCVGWNFE